MKGLELIDDQSGDVKQPDLITKPGSVPATQPKTIVDVVGDNFGSIVQLATDIVKIREIKVKSDAQVAEMDMKSKALLREAQAYATKVIAKSKDDVARMDAVTRMMAAYNSQSNPQISEENFLKIISEFIDRAWPKEHGGE